MRKHQKNKMTPNQLRATILEMFIENQEMVAELVRYKAEIERLNKIIKEMT